MGFARWLPVLLLPAMLGGCLRAYECPACGDAATAPDLPADAPNPDVSAVDLGRDTTAADAHPDVAPLDAAPDAPYPFDGHVACTSSIINSEIELVFDHYLGCIEELIFKLGSNTNVVDVYWNYKNGSGPGRLLNESGSKLVTCNVTANTATLEYVNSALYGKKTLTMKWGTTGLMVNVTVSNLKSANQEGGVWKPGGVNDAFDWVRVFKADKTTEDFKLIYPGNYQAIWKGAALGIALFDDNFDEAFGYKYPPGRTVWIGHGMSVDGPHQSFPAAGTYTFSFAIMHKADLLTWLQ
jgi:hypothetical protein